jgi:hypothetical protein
MDPVNDRSAAAPDMDERPTPPARRGSGAREVRADSFPRRLDEILRALPATELENLCSRMAIKIDPAKRIDTPSQIARALVGLPDVRDPGRLAPASRELILRIAEAGGSLLVPSLPAGLEPLIARGILYGRKLDVGVQLVLPTAFVLQLKTWEGEDPRALRALLAQAPFETLSAIATHYLGRPATPPIALSLEAGWEILSDPRRLREEIEKLPPVERRLLEAVEGVGGEVDTQELLDLEREPLRLRGAGGVTATRRGAGFSLERRAFLIPIHPNRHVVPAEVAAVVGADRVRLRETRREEIRSFVLGEDHVPRRARFASDPAFLAVGMALAVREPGHEVRAGVGTPRSLVVKLAQRFGRPAESIALVATLSRSIGLWDVSAVTPATPPGSLTVQELTQALFASWRRGGAWDEARPEGELLRVAEGSRDTSPVGVVREMVLEALLDLGEGRWVPWTSLEGYLAADARVAGLERLLRRWAERASFDTAPTVLDVIRRIALETLPALGIVDLGGDAEAPEALRLTPRGRVLLSRARPTPGPGASKFLDSHVLRVGSQARVASLMALGPFVEVERAVTDLDLVLHPASIARALSAGLEGDAVRSRIEAVAALPSSLSRMLTEASTVVGKATHVAASGFLWIENDDVREMLRTRRPTADLFLDPSPPAGLLLAADVDVDRVVRRCRSVGVEIESDGQTMRARQTPAPPAVEAALRPSTMRPRSKTPLPKR